MAPFLIGTGPFLRFWTNSPPRWQAVSHWRISPKIEMLLRAAIQPADPAIWPSPRTHTNADWLPRWTPMRHVFYPLSLAIFAATGLVAWTWPPFSWAFAALVPLFLIGVRDYQQTTHAVLRNFPVIGHVRYLLEMIRPEINQYFVESNQDGRPFNREDRSVVYQRAKKQLATLPFGTQKDVRAVGYEWIARLCFFSTNDG